MGVGPAAAAAESIDDGVVGAGVGFGDVPEKADSVFDGSGRVRAVGLEEDVVGGGGGREAAGAHVGEEGVGEGKMGVRDEGGEDGGVGAGGVGESEGGGSGAEELEGGEGAVGEGEGAEEGEEGRLEVGGGGDERARAGEEGGGEREQAGGGEAGGEEGDGVRGGEDWGGHGRGGGRVEERECAARVTLCADEAVEVAGCEGLGPLGRGEVGRRHWADGGMGLCEPGRCSEVC